MKSREPAVTSAVDGHAEAADLATKVAALAENDDARSSSSIAAPGEKGPLFSPPAPHGRIWRLLYGIAWLTILSLLTLAALRVLYHDGTYVLTWLNAFTRYVYLPAWLCLFWAAWQKRWILSALSATVVACHLIWLAPNLLPDRSFTSSPEAAAEAAVSRSVRIFFANVNMDNREHESLLQEIAVANPDVVVLVECSRHWYRAFSRSPIAAAYPYGALQRPYGSTTFVISKLPLTKETHNWFRHRDVHTIEMDLGSESLRIIGLHAPRPVYLPSYDYRGFWERTVPMLTNQQGPRVIVGDFNATEHSLVYKQLRNADLRSAHDDRGRGYATTWPNGQLWLPPIRIDQAFLSPEVECQTIVEGIGRGSDHKPLILDVRLRKLK